MLSVYGDQEGGLLACVFEREAWGVCDLWEDASVRSGWLQGLLNMLKHQQALDFMCGNGENSSKIIQKAYSQTKIYSDTFNISHIITVYSL